MRIAVDAMGGDHAPEQPVAGAVLAAQELGLEVTLVGDQDIVRAQLAQHAEVAGLDVVHAEQSIGMDEPPAVAVRRKRQSSIHVGARLLRDGEVQGFVSAGNTGAVMAVVKVIVGTLDGIDRPALAVVLPTQTGRAVVLDVGVNLEPKSQQLVQFAVMGHHFAREILGVESPAVGLLSVGEEAGKGNELIRTAHRALSATPLNFLGNAEARDLYQGRVDVVVCDGFTGNILLKASESTAEMISLMLREEFGRKWGSRLGAFLGRGAFRRLAQRVDYAEFGGAPLLGIRGLAVICHGRSNAWAIRNGVRVAAAHGRHAVNRHIEKALAELASIQAAAPASESGD